MRLAFLVGLEILSSAANVRHLGRGDREALHIMGESCRRCMIIPNASVKKFLPDGFGSCLSGQGVLLSRKHCLVILSVAYRRGFASVAVASA